MFAVVAELQPVQKPGNEIWGSYRAVMCCNFQNFGVVVSLHFVQKPADEMWGICVVTTCSETC